jgi:hypothetical protein
VLSKSPATMGDIKFDVQIEAQSERR